MIQQWLVFGAACLLLGCSAQDPITADQGTELSYGSRPAYLVSDMDDGPLKARLEACAGQSIRKSGFSIGHRGAPLKYPEHTQESYIAAVEMGAGVVECDVTFTADKQLVCRHSQCDLHTTTDILETPLATKCSVPFTAAVLDEDGQLVSPATAKCCTSDITESEFLTLRGRHDQANGDARTINEYLRYSEKTIADQKAGSGTLLTHRQSIELLSALGVGMTPELKQPLVAMPFMGMTQEEYAQQLVDEYQLADIPANKVWMQSFNLDDVLFWIKSSPEFGQQAVYLDGRYDLPDFDHRNPQTWTPSMQQLFDNGVEILAPPLWMLVETDNAGKIVPSTYAEAADKAGLKLIAWSLERSGPLNDGGGWYYQTLNGANTSVSSQNKALINNDGDLYTVLDVLAQQVGVIAVFSDWPGSITYYANCMGLH